MSFAALDPDPTKPQKSRCAPCEHGRCAGCLYNDRFCGCLCGWLTADVLAAFPSLRRKALEESEMNND